MRPISSGRHGSSKQQAWSAATAERSPPRISAIDAAAIAGGSPTRGISSGGPGLGPRPGLAQIERSHGGRNAAPGLGLDLGTGGGAADEHTRIGRGGAACRAYLDPRRQRRKRDLLPGSHHDKWTAVPRRHEPRQRLGRQRLRRAERAQRTVEELGIEAPPPGIESGENRPFALTGGNAGSENLERGQPDQRLLQGEARPRAVARPIRIPVKEPGPTVTANGRSQRASCSPRPRPRAAWARAPPHACRRPRCAVGGHLALGPERGRAGRRCRVEPE